MSDDDDPTYPVCGGCGFDPPDHDDDCPVDLRAQLVTTRAILRDLAAAPPILWGRDHGACRHCGARADVDDAGDALPVDHTAACPWARAVVLVAPPPNRPPGA